MIGKQVKLTKRMARNYLDYPEFIYKNEYKDADVAMQNAMATLLGEVIVGTVCRLSGDPRYFGVMFSNEFGQYFGYYEYKKDFRVI